MTTARHSSTRRSSATMNWLIMGLVVITLLLVGLLVWLLFVDEESSNVGPGTFSDADNTYAFAVAKGWEVSFSDNTARVASTDSKFPAYHVTLKSVREIFDQNWYCDSEFLRNLDLNTMIQRLVPWQVTLTYSNMPCVEDASEAVYLRLYMTINDGRNQQAVVVMGPLGFDAVNWVVARSDPFSGDVPPALVEAMTEAIKTAKRKS
ncbi:MAG TPA: hypothetical protein VHP83_20105 [Aggregatilineaceae bacterium]|nr:hypothetical protein [Aggregatilineaceae bacterium]